MSRLTLPLIFGLILGLAAGLFYAWGISPAPGEGVTPAVLHPDYKAEYIRLVAGTFAVEADLDRARDRLDALGDADPLGTVTALAQRAAGGGDAQAAGQLAALAAALGGRPVAPTPTTTSPAAVETRPIAPTPAEAVTPAPSPTAPPTSASPAGGYELIGQQAVCDPRLRQPLLQVQAIGPGDEQVPGVEVLVEWDGGYDHFFTGLKPELGAGYGDFAMTPGVSYNARLAANPAAAVTDLRAQACTDDADREYPGSWLLIFRIR